MKKRRIDIVNDWIHKSIIWENVTFSDEKVFSLDGSDNWKKLIVSIKILKF